MLGASSVTWTRAVAGGGGGAGAGLAGALRVAAVRGAGLVLENIQVVEMKYLNLI